jgi:hypothetical protein
MRRYLIRPLDLLRARTAHAEASGPSASAPRLRLARGPALQRAAHLLEIVAKRRKAAIVGVGDD